MKKVLETIPKQLLDSQGQHEECIHANDDCPSAEDLQASNCMGLAVQPQLVPLHSLVPESVESAVKMEMIFQAKTDLFSGRYDAASVCALLATLDETDLRCLRDQLHAALPHQIPAAAGRPLIRRNAGSCSRLVDDCWALGSSTAQKILTRFADSQTLRAAERSTPPEPMPQPPTQTSSELSTVRSSIDTLIAAQLRLEMEVTALRSHSQKQDRRLDELTRELEKVRNNAVPNDLQPTSYSGTPGCAVSALERPPLPPPGRPDAAECAVSALERSPLPPPGRPDAAGSAVSALERSPLPPPGREDTTESWSTRRCLTIERNRSSTLLGNPHSEQQLSLARDIAASLDLRSLGMAIACAMQSQAGDSDSEAGGSLPDHSARTSVARAQPRSRPTSRRGADPLVRSKALPGAASEPKQIARPLETRPAGSNDADQAVVRADRAKPKPITGSGAPSHLVAASAEADQTPRATYVIEGIAPAARDDEVRDMISPLVQRLHYFRRLSRHSGAADGRKAYRFEVDATDDPWIMNPVNWPAGLRVRHWTDKLRGQQQPFPAHRSSQQSYHQRPTWNANGSSSRGAGSTRVWFNRNTLNLQ